MEVAYEAIEIEVDKSYKGLKKAERILSSIALHASTPTLYAADTSSNLYAFTVNNERTLRFHQQLKKIYHENAQVLDAWGTYATIIDGKLTMISLPLDKDSPATSLDETKGITCLAAHENARVLCCLVKQNLMVYDWSIQGRLQLRSSHDLTDRQHVPQSILCLGNSAAIIHFKKKLGYINLDTGVLTSLLLPEPVLFTLGVEGKNPSQNLLFVATKDYGMLYHCDTIGRRATIEGRFEWQQPPKTAVAHSPFLLVSFSDKIDVYNIASMQVVQTIPTKNAAAQLVSVTDLTSTDNQPLILHFSLPFNLVLLRMKPLVDQLKYFTHTLRYADAVGLCMLCPSECHVSPEEMKELHLKYALQLFQHHKYDVAFEQFLLGATNGRHVISLFPEELFPRGYNLQRAYSLPALTGNSLSQALEALVVYLEKYRKTRSDSSNEDKVLYDTVLLKAYVLTNNSALQAYCSTPSVADLAESELFLRAHFKWEPLLSLYKCHNMHRKALELLEELNIAEPGRYITGMAEYLESLTDAELVFEFSSYVFSHNPELGLSIFTRNAATSAIDPAAVLSHLKAIPALATPETNVPGLLPMKDGRSIAITYLSQLIYANEVELVPNLHDELVYLLLDAIDSERQKKKDALHARVHLQRGDRLSLLRKQLLSFLQSPLAMYHPERLLSRTPMDMMEERAVLLANMGRHEEVLRLYLHDIRDAALAETYCNECYAHQITDASIYTLFLQTYLRPKSTARSPLLGGIGIHFVAAFMLRHAQYIDVPTALELLPPTLEASTVSAYLQRVLELKVEKKRNVQVQKQLLKIENLNVRDALNKANRGNIRIDIHSACDVCGKPFERGPFLHYPDGSLVHYACQNSASPPLAP